MYELRYYYSLVELQKKSRNYDLVGNYYNKQLANGMRLKKSKLAQYKLNLLKVVKC